MVNTGFSLIDCDGRIVAGVEFLLSLKIHFSLYGRRAECGTHSKYPTNAESCHRRRFTGTKGACLFCLHSNDPASPFPRLASIDCLDCSDPAKSSEARYASLMPARR